MSVFESTNPSTARRAAGRAWELAGEGEQERVREPVRERGRGRWSSSSPPSCSSVSSEAELDRFLGDLVKSAGEGPQLRSRQGGRRSPEERREDRPARRRRSHRHSPAPRCRHRHRRPARLTRRRAPRGGRGRDARRRGSRVRGGAPRSSSSARRPSGMQPWHPECPTEGRRPSRRHRRRSPARTRPAPATTAAFRDRRDTSRRPAPDSRSSAPPAGSAPASSARPPAALLRRSGLPRPHRAVAPARRWQLRAVATQPRLARCWTPPPEPQPGHGADAPPWEPAGGTASATAERAATAWQRAEQRRRGRQRRRPAPPTVMRDRGDSSGFEFE